MTVTREQLDAEFPEAKGYDLDKMLVWANTSDLPYAPSDCHRHDYEVETNGRFRCVSFGGCGRSGWVNLQHGDPFDYGPNDKVQWHWKRTPRWWERLLMWLGL